jgi:hypothetical protein
VRDLLAEGAVYANTSGAFKNFKKSDGKPRYKTPKRSPAVSEALAVICTSGESSTAVSNGAVGSDGDSEDSDSGDSDDEDMGLGEAEQMDLEDLTADDDDYGVTKEIENAIRGVIERIPSLD